MEAGHEVLRARPQRAPQIAALEPVRAPALGALLGALRAVRKFAARPRPLVVGAGAAAEHAKQPRVGEDGQQRAVDPQEVAAARALEQVERDRLVLELL